MLNRLFAAAAIAFPVATATAFSGALAEPLPQIIAQPIPVQSDLSQTGTPQIEVYTARPGTTQFRRSDRFYRSDGALFSTYCTYSPGSGEPNPLGQRAFITVTEVAGTSIFRYEQFAAIASTPQASNPRQYEGSYPSVADVASTRSVTFYDTPLAIARQQLANSPAQYAELLGRTPNDPIVRQGFSSVDRLLACQQVGSSSTASVSEITSRRFGTPIAINREIETPSRAIRFILRTAAPQLDLPQGRAQPKTIAGLPDGNYRYASSLGESFGGGFINGEALASGDRLFTFRKSGSLVTGNFTYVDSGENACVSGVLQGNTVVGEAYTSSFGINVLGRTYLGPGLSLQLSESSSENNAVLSLSGFSRINVGEVTPPTSCR